MKEFKIRLENLKFYSYIGVMPQEREVGNNFIVDVSLVIDASGFEYENLETTISYAEIYEIVADEMKIKRQLLESTATTIAERIEKTWNNAQHIKVKITKLTPPISGIDGHSSVEYVIV